MTEIYEVRIKDQFSAVHQLESADGSIEPLHGHDWRVEALFRSKRLNDQQMVIDFHEASAMLRTILAGLNYANLNTVDGLPAGRPTAEAVARFVFQRLRDRLGGAAPLHAVYVEEAPGCIAGYLQVEP